jgi:hypothetical protein
MGTRSFLERAIHFTFRGFHRNFSPRNRIDWSNHASCTDPVDPPDAPTRPFVDESTHIPRGLEVLTNDLAETRAFDLRKTEK